MKLVKFIVGLCFSFLFTNNVYSQDKSEIFTTLDEVNIPNKLGLNGSFIGIHNDALIVAGGANFPGTPVWEGGKKHWYNTIYILEKKGDKNTWYDSDVKLPVALANGVSVNTPKGVLCIGGDNETDTFKEVFLLKWNVKTKKIEIENLAPMPVSLANMGASVVEDIVYVVGGQETKGGNTTTNFLSFSLKSLIGRKAYEWKKHADFPGKDRMQPVVVGQNNGHQECLYVFSGISYNSKKTISHEMLDDVYEFNPKRAIWKQKKSIPNNYTPDVSGGYIGAAPSIKMGDSHIVIFGGAGGKEQHLSERLKLKEKIFNLKKKDTLDETAQLELVNLEAKATELFKATSFSKTIWAYHTITDTWSKRGALKNKTQVVTKAIS